LHRFRDDSCHLAIHTLVAVPDSANAREAKELADALQTFAKKHNISTDVDKAYKLHMKGAVAKKTFDGLGVHCPYDTAGDIGYRPLSVTEKELKKVLQRVRMMGDGTAGRLSAPADLCV
jgi:hypothetical protein